MDLDLPEVEWGHAARLESLMRGPEFFSVESRPRRHWLRPPKARLDIEARAHDILAEDADWGEEVYRLEPAGAERLARTIEVLGRELPPGWSVRGEWVGDPVDAERRVSAAELADRCRAIGLERGVRYVVG